MMKFREKYDDIWYYFQKDNGAFILGLSIRPTKSYGKVLFCGKELGVKCIE